MLAEQKSDDGDAPSSSWRPKPWEVTNVEGFMAWKLRIDAMIASNTDLSMFAGIHVVTEALATAGVPGYAAMAPVDKAQILRAYRDAHEKAVNRAYATLLSTIDLSKDTTLLRKINSDFAPQPGKRPAQLWQIIDILAARGDRGLRTNQIALEARVADWRVPFGKSAPELTRSFKAFIADWWDLDTNAHASSRLLVRTLVARMREGGVHWQMHASTIELDAAKDLSQFDDMPSLIQEWEQTIFVFFASKDANAPMLAPIGACGSKASSASL